MKPLYIAIVLLPLFSFAQFSMGTTELSADITFGKGADCAAGRGTCSFRIQNTTLGNENSFPYKVKPINENSFLILLKRSALTLSQEEKIAGQHFQSITKNDSPNFVLEEPLALDMETVKLLNLSSNIIPAGTYPLTLDEDYAYLFITLNTKQ